MELAVTFILVGLLGLRELLRAYHGPHAPAPAWINYAAFVFFIIFSTLVALHVLEAWSMARS